MEMKMGEFMEIQVKGEAAEEFDCTERLMSVDNNDVIEDVSDPLDFFKVECLVDSNSQDVSPKNEQNDIDQINQYECNICHERFPIKEELRKHSLIHNSINHIFTCDQCSECFVTRTSLNTHKLTHSAENTLECDICHKLFSSLTSLGSHKRTHQLAECVICHKRFADGKELDKHIFDKHKVDDKNHQCDICQDNVSSAAGLKKRIRIHRDTEKESDKCHKRFDEIDEDEFLKEREESGYENYICHKTVSSSTSLICNKLTDSIEKCDEGYTRFEDGKELSIHKLNERRRESNYEEVSSTTALQISKHICQSVDYHKRFADSKGLEKHTNEQCDHVESPMHLMPLKSVDHGQNCYKCHKRFPNIKDLNEHILKEHDAKNYKFDVCFKPLSSPAALKSQKRIHHLEECDMCQKRLNPIFLKRHKRNVHSNGLFKCDVCCESFDNNVSLNTHKFSHIGGKITFTCKICDEKFDTPEKRNEHERGHQSEKIKNDSKKLNNPYECPICHTLFANKINLNYHTKTHHFIKNAIKTMEPKKQKHRQVKSIKSVYKRYTCRICHRRFADKVDLIFHRKTHHINDNINEKNNSINDSKSHECTICHKRFQHKSNLKFHSNSHIDSNKKIQCVICHKVFLNIFLLDQHETALHPDDAIFQCHICQKRFDNKYSHQNHVRFHIVERSYECKLCTKKFHTSQDLKRHVTIHLKDRPYKCGICRKRFAHKKNLLCHIKSHHGDSEIENNYQIDCNFCNEEFPSVTELAQHKQMQHSLDCDICHKRFTTKYVLRDHMRIHTGEMPFECEECHRQFRTLMNLNGHMIVHKQEKRHECSICHEWFTRRSNLKYHLNKQHFFSDFECDVCHEQFTNEYNRDQHKITQHSDDAIFECDTCHKRFKNKYALREHDRIHTGEKPYKCKICHKRFRTGPNLNSHVDSVHKQDKNHECYICHKRFSRGSNLNRHVKIHLAGGIVDAEKNQ